MELRFDACFRRWLYCALFFSPLASAECEQYHRRLISGEN
jgi:hypothetical protein